MQAFDFTNMPLHVPVKIICLRKKLYSKNLVLKIISIWRHGANFTCSPANLRAKLDEDFVEAALPRNG